MVAVEVESNFKGVTPCQRTTKPREETAGFLQTCSFFWKTRNGTMMLRFSLVLFAALAAQLTGTSAFVAPSQSTAARVSTQLQGNTKQPPELPPIQDISYGEESRKFRRTVYSHDDWRKHRSQDRFIRNIKSMFVSGVYKNLGREVAATTAVATFICLYNAIVGGYTDFEGQKQAALISSTFLPLLGLPLAPFTLSSPSLGLLLGKLAPAVHSSFSVCSTRSLIPIAQQFSVPTLHTSVGTKRERTGE